MKPHDMLPWPMLAELPALVSGYLLALTGADSIVERPRAVATGGSPSVDDLAAGVRTMKRCTDILHSHAERADMGARLGEVFEEHAWLQRFDFTVDLEWAVGDEGQIYESTRCLVGKVESLPGAPLPADVQAEDGSFDDAAAEAVIEAFFDDNGHELALLLREETDEGSWNLSLTRAAIDAELSRQRPSGKAIWDALFPQSPGLAPTPPVLLSDEQVEPCLPIELHALGSFAEVVQAQLAANGYEVHLGAKGQDPELEGRWWFSWTAHGMLDAEVGDTVDTELDAWLDALQHRLANSEIPLHQTE